MATYFGTDGIRGVANTELTPDFAFRLGRVGGYVLTQTVDKPKILIGKDTRISGYMLENALTAGLLSIGVEVMRLGVISTPGVAYLTRAVNAQAGVMISASHNPVEFNGVKFFGADGYKLTDAQESDIERLLNESDTLPRPTGSDLGMVNDYFEGGQKYLSFLKDSIDNDFEGIHIALDCAHGSNSSLATHLFADLEAEIVTMGSSPNGLNINDGVGSTHPEALQAFVTEKGTDIGLAFDGDGDRLIAIDEKGNIVDGDQIMFICAKYMNEKGLLNEHTVVSTVMSNLGFYKALENHGMHSDKTDVGDRYVTEEMRNGGYNLGGEQSGHIIFLDYNSTGDGMLTALQLVNAVKDTGKTLSELAGEMRLYPQVLKNVHVIDKDRVINHSHIQDEIDKVEKDMAGDGRVLVRPSGTEPLIRVMVEAPTEEACERYANQVVKIIDDLMGMQDEG